MASTPKLLNAKQATRGGSSKRSEKNPMTMMMTTTRTTMMVMCMVNRTILLTFVLFISFFLGLSVWKDISDYRTSKLNVKFSSCKLFGKNAIDDVDPGAMSPNSLAHLRDHKSTFLRLLMLVMWQTRNVCRVTDLATSQMVWHSSRKRGQSRPSAPECSNHKLIYSSTKQKGHVLLQ